MMHGRRRPWAWFGVTFLSFLLVVVFLLIFFSFFFLFSVALLMTGAAGHQGTQLLSGLRARWFYFTFFPFVPSTTHLNWVTDSFPLISIRFISIKFVFIHHSMIRHIWWQNTRPFCFGFDWSPPCKWRLMAPWNRKQLCGSGDQVPICRTYWWLSRHTIDLCPLFR